MTDIEGLQSALEVQLQYFEDAKKRDNYLEMSNIADKISKLSYAIHFMSKNQKHSTHEMKTYPMIDWNVIQR